MSVAASAVQYSGKCTSKGVGRQGEVLKHMDCLQKELVPCRPLPMLVQL